MKTYELYHPKSPKRPFGDPNLGHATRRVDFTVTNEDAVVISAWAWDAGTVKWTPCFESKKIPNRIGWDPEWMLFHHSIGVTKVHAREIWSHYRKEGWV